MTVGTVPVLKPREVSHCSKLTASPKFGSAGLTSSSGVRWPCDGRPDACGRDVAPTLLRKIARDVGLTIDECLAKR
jgi:hypothetical protein